MANLKVRMVSLLLLSLLEQAHAQTTSREAGRSSSEAALGRGHRALALYAEGSWEEAYDEFTAAERLAHSPVFRLYMARCRWMQGQLVEARRLFVGVSESVVSEGAPQAWRDAIVTARKEASEVERLIPRIEFEPSTTFGRIVSISIDGKPVMVSDVVALDPGAHSLVLTSEHHVLTKAVHLREGEVVRLPLEAHSAPLQVAKEGPVGERRGNQARERATWVSYTLIGTGVALVGVGAVLALQAQQKLDDVRGRCDGVHCWPEDEAKAASAERLAGAATLTFVLGGLGVLSGTTLLLTTGSSRSSDVSRTLTLAGQF